MKVIITIPAYNEEKTIPRVLAEIREVLSSTAYRYEILVVDDGSKDRTAEIAEQHGARVVRKKHQGLAETFQIEMQECLKLKADIIVHTDADGQYHPQHIPELIAKVQEGYDLILGNRFSHQVNHIRVTSISICKLHFIGIVNIIAIREIDKQTHVPILISELVVPSSSEFWSWITNDGSVFIQIN